MKLKMRRWYRPIIAGTGLAINLGAVLWLNRPLQLPYAAPLPPAPVAQAEPGGSSPASNTRASSPEVNPTAFKDQGDLAFVWQGLLYTLDGNTGEVKQLTESGQARQPLWSPDGEWLAFMRATDLQATTGPLWLVRRDGSQAHQVQGLPSLAGPQLFSWSPTASVLAVSGNDGLWLVPVAGAPRRLVVTSGTVGFAWSPDGKYLAYSETLPYDSKDPESRSDALYTVSVDGGAPVKRVEAPQAGIIIAGWWADGRGVLYWLDPLHSASLAADGLGLLSLRIGDTKPTRLATGLPHRDWLSLSPQGKLLMVTGSGRIVWNNKQLAISDPGAGSVRALDNPAGTVAIDPSLAQDGRRIAFVAARDLGNKVWGFSKPEELTAWINSRTLWIANSDGSGAHPLTTAGTGIYQPAWSRDGSHILYIRDNALWLIGADGGKPEKVVGPFPDRQEPFGFYGYVSYQDMMAWFQS